jgi:hypothetical protein
MGKLYAIHIYEQEVTGVPGMEDYVVIEAINIKDAEYVVSEIELDLSEDYKNYYIHYAKNKESLKETNVGNFAWDIYELTEETNASLVELCSEYWNDPDSFLIKYGCITA